MLNGLLGNLRQQITQHRPQQKLVWFGLALLVILLDQSTKYMASDALALYQSLEFLPYFNFTLLHNYGAAFSFLSDAGGWQRLFLSVIAAVVSLFLVVWLLCAAPTKKLEMMGLSLVLGGAIGNLWDRINLGYVVDFVDWFYVTESAECLPFFYAIAVNNSCHWPAFNIADASILLGATCLIIDMLLSAPADSNKNP